MSITSTLKNVLFSSGGAKILIGLVTFFIIIGVIIYFIYRFIKKNYIYKYKFLVVNVMGNMSVKKARIKLNQQKVEVFELEGLPNKPLDIKEPNVYYNGAPMRMVAYDGQGNIAWTNGIKIDKEQYLKTALTAPERQMAAQAAIDAGSKYDVLTTPMKAAIGMSIVVIMIMVIGMYANGKLALMTTDKAAETATTMLKTQEYQSQNVEAINENTEMFMTVLHFLGADGYNISLVAE
jgi:hypothetical protein